MKLVSKGRTATTPNNLLLGSCILNANEIRRMTTGLKAFNIWMKETLKLSKVDSAKRNSH